MTLDWCCFVYSQYVIDSRLDEVWRDYIFDLVAIKPLTLPPTHTQLCDCYRHLLTVFRQSAAKFVSCLKFVTLHHLHKLQVNN